VFVSAVKVKDANLASKFLKVMDTSETDIIGRAAGMASLTADWLKLEKIFGKHVGGVVRD